MPTPLHPCGWQCHGEGLALHMGIGWELPQGRDGGGHRLSAAVPPPPCTSTPATRTPPPPAGHETDTTSQSLIGAARATSLTPRHTTRTPPPQNNTQKGGAGLGTPPYTPTATQRHSKSTQQGPGSASPAGIEGLGGGRGGQGLGEVGAGAWVLQPKCYREKHLRAHPGEGRTPSPPPQRAPRLWGGNGAGGAQGGEGGLLGAL